MRGRSNFPPSTDAVPRPFEEASQQDDLDELNPPTPRFFSARPTRPLASQTRRPFSTPLRATRSPFAAPVRQDSIPEENERSLRIIPRASRALPSVVEYQHRPHGNNQALLHDLGGSEDSAGERGLRAVDRPPRHARNNIRESDASLRPNPEANALEFHETEESALRDERDGSNGENGHSPSSQNPSGSDGSSNSERTKSDDDSIVIAAERLQHLHRSQARHFQDSLWTLHDVYDGIFKENSSTIDSMKDTLIENKCALKELRNELNCAKQKRAELERAVAKMNGEATTLKHKCKNLEMSMHEQRERGVTTNQELRKQVAKLELESGRLRSVQGSLQTSLNERTNEYDKVKMELKHLQHSYQEQIDRRRESEDENHELHEQVLRMRHLFAQAEKEAKEMNTAKSIQISELVNYKNTFGGKVIELERAKKELKEQFTDMIGKVKDARLVLTTFYTWYNDLQLDTDRLCLEKAILAWTRGRPSQFATQVQSLLNNLSLPGRLSAGLELEDLESELSSAMRFVRDLVRKFIQRETVLADVVQDMCRILDCHQKMLQEVQDGMKVFLHQPKDLKSKIEVGSRTLRSHQDLIFDFLRRFKQGKRISKELKKLMSQQKAQKEKEMKEWCQRLEDAKNAHHKSQQAKDECIARLQELHKQDIDLSSNKLGSLQSELDKAKRENEELSSRNATLKSFETLLKETKREYVISLENNESLKIRLEAKDADINKLKSQLDALRGRSKQQEKELKCRQAKQPHSPEQHKESHEDEISRNPLKLQRSERGKPLHKPNPTPSTPEKSHGSSTRRQSESNRPCSRRESGLRDKLGDKGFENQASISPSARRKKRSVRKVHFSENEELSMTGADDTQKDEGEIHKASKRKIQSQSVPQMSNPKRSRTRKKNAASSSVSQRTTGRECESFSSDEWLNDPK